MLPSMSHNASVACRLVSGFAALLVVSAAGAQVSRHVEVKTVPTERVITIHPGGGVGGQQSSSEPSTVGSLGGIPRAPSISPGGFSGTEAQPTLAERWLQNDATWLDQNMMRWMNRHPVLLKQP